MTKYTIFKVLEKLYDKNNTEVLYKLVQEGNIEKANQILECFFKISKFEKEEKNEILELRELKYKILLQNQNSIFKTLDQTYKIEEILEFIFSYSHSTDLILTLTCFNDFEKSFFKLAQLELKQIIMIITFEMYDKDIADLAFKFEYLLAYPKLNYRYLLGFDSIDGKEETIASQFCFHKPSITISNSTRIEKSVYHRYNFLNKKYDQIIGQNFSDDTITTLNSLFYFYKQSNKLNSHSLSILWKDIMRELSKIYKSAIKNGEKQEDEDQIDLWSWQKTNKCI